MLSTLGSYRNFLIMAISVTTIVAVLLFKTASDSTEVVLEYNLVSDKIIQKSLYAARIRKLARERSLLISRIIHQNDVFKRDNLSSEMRNKSLEMTRIIQEFHDLDLTDEQRETFDAAFLLMQKLTPQIIKISNFDQNDTYHEASEILYKSILPSQDKVIGYLSSLEALIGEERNLNNQLLHQIIDENQKNLVLFMIIFMIVFVSIFIIAIKIFSSRETVLKEQQKQLEKYNVVNRNILDTAPDAIINIDDNSVIHRANEASVILLGYQEEELLEKSFTILLLSDKQGGEYKLMSAAQIRQRRLPREVLITTKQGVQIPVLLSVRNTGIDGDYKYTCVFHDLRRIKATQKQLIAQKSAMDEHSLVSITNLEGHIIYVNEKFCRVSGYAENELMGQSHNILNSNNKTPSYWKEMYLGVARGDVWHDEVRNRNKLGKDFWVDTTIVGLYDDNGHLNGYTSIRTDITAKKEQEMNLIFAKAQAEHDAVKLLDAKVAAEAATIAKTQFLATMSHEIRTPMNGVIGMTQILEDTPLNEEQRYYLNTIKSSGKNLLTIINDILDFSKLDSEKAELEIIAFDLERACYECLTVLVPQIEAKNIELIFDYDPHCPNFFKGDPSRIRQIILNLLGNAIKFTQHGYVRIGISASQNNGETYNLMIEVQDTGIGLKPNAVEHIFDEFSQADSSTTRSFGGTGLGLAISKKLAVLMSGYIVVESEWEVGSIFKLKIQLDVAEVPKRKEQGSLNKTRILLVDDIDINREIYKRLLSHMGAKVTVMSNESSISNVLIDAIKAGNAYEILLLDNAMPKISGLDIGMEIRKDSRLDDLKLMMFSSVNSKGDVAQIQKAGFDAYLNKLTRYSTLQGVLSILVAHKRDGSIITQYSLDDPEHVQEKETDQFSGSVLLVDDVVANKIVAKLILEQLGLKVETADDGQQAIDAYKQTSYDLIFMDCRMPIVDGYEATQEIRSIEKAHNVHNAIPIIALTANVTQIDIDLCHAAGMDDVVTKPFLRNDIINCLNNWFPETSCATSNDEIKSGKIPISTLDKDIYLELKETMGSSFTEMVTASRDGIQSDIGLLLNSKPETPIIDLLRWAHSIKAPASYIGALKMNEIAIHLEAKLLIIEEGTLDDSHKTLIQQLSHEYQNMCKALDELPI